MKRYLLILTMGTLVNIGLGQEVFISNEQSIRPEHDYEIIGKVGDRIMVLKEENNDIEVQAFDEKMNEIWKKEVPLERRPSLIGSAATNNDFTILYSYKKHGETHVKARKYDNKLRLIDSTTVRVFERRAFSPTFTARRSQNRQILLMFNVLREKELEAFAFDTRSMKVLWQYDFRPADFYYRRDFLQLIVDNQGGGHLIIERDNKRNTKETNRFEFFYYDPIAQKPSIYTLGLPDRLWYDVLFDYDEENQQLVAGGLYANDFMNETNGFFYLRIKPRNPTDYHTAFQAFNTDLIQEVLGKDKPTKKDGFGEVDIQEIVIRRDGGILLVAERNRKYVRQISNLNSAYYSNRYYDGSQIDYYYNDIIVFSIHPSGEEHWSKILHKKQYSQDDNALFSSFFIAKTPTNLRFLYNDEIKQESTVNEYILTGFGQQERKNILNTSGTKLMLVMRNALQVSANEIIIPSERRRELRLMRLLY